MKTIFLATIILLPCLLIFNESEYLYINIIGASYILLLFVATKKSSRIKQLWEDLLNETEYLTDKMMKL